MHREEAQQDDGDGGAEEGDAGGDDVPMAAPTMAMARTRMGSRLRRLAPRARRRWARGRTRRSRRGLRGRPRSEPRMTTTSPRRKRIAGEAAAGLGVPARLTATRSTADGGRTRPAWAGRVADQGAVGADDSLRRRWFRWRWSGGAGRERRRWPARGGRGRPGVRGLPGLPFSMQGVVGEQELHVGRAGTRRRNRSRRMTVTTRTAPFAFVPPAAATVWPAMRAAGGQGGFGGVAGHGEGGLDPAGGAAVLRARGGSRRRGRRSRGRPR